MGKKLGFGCMRLPLLDKADQTSINMEILNKMVDAFLARGFTYFDTAYVYHNMKSEIAVREALVKRYPRDKFTLATKLLPRVLKAAEEQERIFQEQLEKCGVEFFDYYLIHNLGESSYRQACKFDTFGFVAAKKKAGQVKKMGFSFHATPELLDEILTAHPEVDFVQLQINYIDWENSGIQSRRCYETARKHQVPVIVMEPCKGGNLAKIPAKAEALMKAYNPEASVPSWAIRFAAGLEGVSMVLSGMSALDQVLDNTAYMADFKPLNAEENKIIEQVTAIINEDNVIPCTTCHYCEEGCPQHIAIPDYFALYNNAKANIAKGFSSQFVYYLNLTATHGKAGDCTGCQQCEKACPQHIRITEHLKDVAKMFDSVSFAR